MSLIPDGTLPKKGDGLTWSAYMKKLSVTVVTLLMTWNGWLTKLIKPTAIPVG